MTENRDPWVGLILVAMACATIIALAVIFTQAGCG